ncbi:hypothetical protein L249_4399 [Ophiocordyceps polyrhachis-furcata BCC 54312]|uniref:Uncharacterized protein n=1 Tax=Ophiocordyceps polyrhachis-furcata BCC 54312 TaxID=1330021 RepID=A0A367L7E6_9HYPO|nr:hypothetical protein L249_4399 [Ophiocordyceps polyrhachis-furcata BCC 54312]
MTNQMARGAMPADDFSYWDLLAEFMTVVPMVQDTPPTPTASRHDEKAYEKIKELASRDSAVKNKGGGVEAPGLLCRAMPHDGALTDSSSPSPGRKTGPAAAAVWFPEGYWAERRLLTQRARKSNSSLRFWKWRTRSNKSATSEAEASDPLAWSYPSTTSSAPAWLSTAESNAFFADSQHPALSPFLSERTHVLSLQHPTGITPTGEPSMPGEAQEENMVDAMPQNTNVKRVSAAATSQGTSKSRRSTSSWYNSTRNWFGRTMGALRGREVCMGARVIVVVAVVDDADRPMAETRYPPRVEEEVVAEALPPPPSAPQTVVWLLGRLLPRHGGDKRSFKSANSQFPGNEAVRVSTPPLDEDTADGKPRGFFTCTTPPSVPTRPASAAPRHAAPGSLRRSSLSVSTREWWEAPPARSARPPVFAAAGFQFDVPEHLPSSPMCPINSRSRPGSTGVCVYHGRARGSKLRRGSTPPGTED